VQLRAVSLPLGSAHACADHLEALDASEQGADVLCAGGDDGEPGACHRDSGDPAMFQDASGAWKLAGVVSAGGPDCDEYTLISKLGGYRDWIAAQIEQP
jgi:secreted trypsin-like serine protease